MSGRNTVKEDQTLPVESEFLLYQTENGETRIEVSLQGGTIWMKQAPWPNCINPTAKHNDPSQSHIYGRRTGDIGNL